MWVILGHFELIWMDLSGVSGPLIWKIQILGFFKKKVLRKCTFFLWKMAVFSQKWANHVPPHTAMFLSGSVMVVKFSEFTRGNWLFGCHNWRHDDQIHSIPDPLQPPNKGATRPFWPDLTPFGEPLSMGTFLESALIYAIWRKSKTTVLFGDLVNKPSSKIFLNIFASYILRVFETCPLIYESKVIRFDEIFDFIHFFPPWGARSAPITPR